MTDENDLQLPANVTPISVQTTDKPQRLQGYKLRREMFVDAYCSNGFNGTQAAITAGYSARTANEQAARLLATVSVQAAVEVRRQAMVARFEVTADRIMQQLAWQAFGDLRRIVTWRDNRIQIKDSDELAAEDIAGIVEVSEETSPRGTRTIRVKKADPQRAMDMLARMLGLYNDKLKLEVVLDAERQKVREEALARGLDVDAAIAEWERMLREAGVTS